MFNNSTGNGNTASGDSALYNNTSGAVNTALGFQAMLSNTNGFGNTTIGTVSMGANTTGSVNTAVGYGALSINTAGSNNTAIGYAADVSAGSLSNATAIGANAIVNASNKIRLGNSAVTVIEGQVPFTSPSDGRFKFNIRDDVKGLDFILKLHPVTYQFDVKRFDNFTQAGTISTDPKNDNIVLNAAYIEATAIRRTGFIAQEVEKAAFASGYNFSGIVIPKNKKDHYSLSYESFVVPLVKAVQEQQTMINEQSRKLEQQQEQINILLKEVQLLKDKIK
jgi:hypothetical protein